jgi:iron complex transport system substrate-binding protein
MKKIIRILTLLLTLSILLSGCAQGEVSSTTPTPSETSTSQEDIKETTPPVVALEQPIVVAGTVSATRILHGLGVELTAVPQTNKPLDAELALLPQIGLPMNPDIELVKSHDPAFFITDASLEERLSASLTEHEINTIFLKTSSYQNILDAITEMGDLFAKQDKAKEMTNHILNLEAQALALSKDQKPLNVAIIFGTPDSFMLATKSSYVGDLSARLGATNITDSMPEARAPYVPFSLETLAQLNPDVILRLTHANPEESKKMFDAAFNTNPFYDALKAVKENRVIDLDSNYFGVVATIDCGEALLKLAEHFYAQ